MCLVCSRLRHAQPHVNQSQTASMRGACVVPGRARCGVTCLQQLRGAGPSTPPEHFMAVLGDPVLQARLSQATKHHFHTEHKTETVGVARPLGPHLATPLHRLCQLLERLCPFRHTEAMGGAVGLCAQWCAWAVAAARGDHLQHACMRVCAMDAWQLRRVGPLDMQAGFLLCHLWQHKRIWGECEHGVATGHCAGGSRHS